MEKVDISKHRKEDVLAALYNASRPLGMGYLHYEDENMTSSEAKEIIDQGYTSFDYLKGRVMKVDISGDSFYPDLYDRDNGSGAAQRAVDGIKP